MAKEGESVDEVNCDKRIINRDEEWQSQSTWF